MYQLKNLSKLNKKRKRVGRGGSRGGTAGKGHKGQLARSGKKLKPGFEGGQMPLARRLPKRGFNNKRFQDDIEIVSLSKIDKAFNDGESVSRKELISAGLIKGRRGSLIKILGGTLSKKLTIKVDKFSVSVDQQVKNLGGSISRLAAKSIKEATKKVEEVSVKES